MTAADSSADYQKIAAALRFIESRPDASLAEVAANAGLSAAHFQRLFSRWAGVSPKKYAQHLRLDLAREMLRARRAVLDVALEAGLSGPGRLHDLFLTWEAMTPGEYARKGAGLRVDWSWLQTPFGEALAMATDKGLCGLAFVEEVGRAAAMDDMRARWPDAAYVEDSAAAAMAQTAMSGSGGRLHLLGGPFQIKVWEALLAIPSGYVATYSDIAERVGAPKAARAVGTAVGRNPVSLLIPCHRALRKSGELGGYHWGLPVKRAMLAYENARAEAV